MPIADVRLVGSRSADGTTSSSTSSAALPTYAPGAPNVAQGQATTSTTPASAVPARATRRTVTVVNHDGTINILVGGPTVTASGATGGVLLRPYGSISIDTTGAVWAVAASGTAILGWIESYD